MWLYKQSTGELFFSGPVTAPVEKGYSGAGEHRNNPGSQCISDLGPIPRGDYAIGPPTDFGDPPHVVKYALPLTPLPSTDTCGRKGFYIHGESGAFPGWASAGCIIMSKATREKIVQSGDKDLRVVS